MSDIFKEHIKQWVTIDNNIRNSNNEIKQMREKRTDINNNIIRYIETNQLTDSTIQLSDGYLKFNSQKNYAPLTFQFLQDTLKDILPESQVTSIINYIKEKRNTQSSIIIKRIID
tara:strand:- start:17165 stop:17509 length:345 start_codon:yes stop_codon:yes gene_type:complete